MKIYLAVCTILALSTDLSAQSNDPLQGVLATTTPFEGLMNRADLIEGADMFRVKGSLVQVGYTSASANAKLKASSSSSKYDIGMTFYHGGFVHEFENGLHAGFGILNSEENFKYKSTSANYKAKLANARNVLSVGGVLQGLNAGMALAIRQNTEDSKVTDLDSSDAFEKSANWGEINPQFYYAGSSYDVILKYGPTMRHETIDKPAFTELTYEQKLTDAQNLFIELKHERNSETDDDDTNHLSGQAGLRFVYDQSLLSNALVLITAEDAYARGPRKYDLDTVANYGLSLLIDHRLNKQHAIGAALGYVEGAGRNSFSEKQKITTSTTGVQVNYGFFM